MKFEFRMELSSNCLNLWLENKRKTLSQRWKERNSRRNEINRQWNDRKRNRSRHFVVVDVKMAALDQRRIRCQFTANPCSYPQMGKKNFVEEIASFNLMSLFLKLSNLIELIYLIEVQQMASSLQRNSFPFPSNWHHLRAISEQFQSNFRAVSNEFWIISRAI